MTTNAIIIISVPFYAIVISNYISMNGQTRYVSSQSYSLIRRCIVNRTWMETLENHYSGQLRCSE
jgi:hypothetical protein